MGGLLHSEIDVDPVGEIGEHLCAQQMSRKNYAGFNLDNDSKNENKDLILDIYSSLK
jgi:hypothetical protein